MEPIPLLVEHVAVDFIVEPFRPSGAFSSNYEDIRPVMPSYFPHNWETRGERGRLVPSRTGPKDLPTA